MCGVSRESEKRVEPLILLVGGSGADEGEVRGIWCRERGFAGSFYRTNVFFVLLVGRSKEKWRWTWTVDWRVMETANVCVMRIELRDAGPLKGFRGKCFGDSACVFGRLGLVHIYVFF